MQLLTFTVAGQGYAIPSKRVIEVLPLVPARPVPRTPDYILGLFTYRGNLLPLVDLSSLIAGSRPAARLSTRVIVVEFSRRGSQASGSEGLVRLGLVAENVVSIRSVEGGKQPLTAMELADAPYLGSIVALEGRSGVDAGTAQLIELDRLLPDDLLHGLAPGPTETTDEHR